MNKKILVTENQLKNLVLNISEEAAGYDDFDVMYQHGGVSIGTLVETLKDLALIFKSIGLMIRSKNLEYVDLIENLKESVGLIDEISKITNVVFKDFTDKEVVKTGKILNRKLESYQEKVTMLIRMGDELLSRKTLLEKLAEYTKIVLEYINDYAFKLKDSEITFRKRLEKGKPFKRPDMN
jgi:hypothetical protein